MEVWINGEAVELGAGAHVADAVAALGLAGTGVAVALEDEVVPRVDWAVTPLAAGARVEVLTAVQGG